MMLCLLGTSHLTTILQSAQQKTGHGSLGTLSLFSVSVSFSLSFSLSLSLCFSQMSANLFLVTHSLSAPCHCPFSLLLLPLSTVTANLSHAIEHVKDVLSLSSLVTAPSLPAGNVSLTCRCIAVSC